MFRYERPQAGRRRQFWQLGVEYLDVEAPPSDAEVIELGYRFLTSVGVPAMEVRLNSLGDSECRPGYVAELRAFLEERFDELCDESKPLVDTNPLRVLDCKICAPKLEDAPRMADRLCEACLAHFGEVKSLLDGLGVPYLRIIAWSAGSITTRGPPSNTSPSTWRLPRTRWVAVAGTTAWPSPSVGAGRPVSGSPLVSTG